MLVLDRFGRISLKLGLTTLLRGWMPSESTSQVPSRSAAQFAIPAAGNLPQLKVLSKFFLGCPCPPAPAPTPAPEVWSSRLDLCPLPCTLSLGGFCGFRVPMNAGFCRLNYRRSWVLLSWIIEGAEGVVGFGFHWRLGFVGWIIEGAGFRV